MTILRRGVQFSACNGTGARVDPSKTFWASHVANPAPKPVVLAVGANDRDCLLDELPERPVDRGTKHQARGLGSYASRHSGLMEIRAGYRHAGQARRGLCSLYSRLIDDAARAIWLVILAQEVFESIWERAPVNGMHASACESAPGFNDIEQRLEDFKHEEVPKKLTDRLVGTSRATDLVRRQIVRAARLQNSLLILGETGTGKEIVAREIHRLSARKDKPFIARNCAAIPKELVESVLFGHIKGSFTGATSKQLGVWLEAKGGILFLDEIVELEKATQVKLFRVMDSGKVAPLGGGEEEETNARLICATNQVPEVLLRQGHLRHEFYQRLTMMTVVRTPSLRSRFEDLQPIAKHLWLEIAGSEAPPIPQSAIELLCEYSWPGNIRQLQGFLRQVHFRFEGRGLDRECVASAMREWGYL